MITCEGDDVADVALGASVQLQAGPFLDAAGVPINLSAGWTITLTWTPPSGGEQASEDTPSGTSGGMITYTVPTGELDETDVWIGLFRASNGSGITRSSRPFRLNVRGVSDVW